MEVLRTVVIAIIEVNQKLQNVVEMTANCNSEPYPDVQMTLYTYDMSQCSSLWFPYLSCTCVSNTAAIYRDASFIGPSSALQLRVYY